MNTSLKNTYPVHLTDESKDDLNDQSKTDDFRNHFFDFPDTHKSSRVRKDDISKGLAPMRNVDGVRVHHRINESKILPHIREGLADRKDSQVRLQEKIKKFKSNPLDML